MPLIGKPFIVEFAGPPKSGKTTIIERIKYQLPYSFSIMREVSLDSPVEKKKTLKYMEWSANELINKLISAEELVRKQVILVDCGIASQLALLEAFKRDSRIKTQEIRLYNLIKDHLLLNLQREHIIFYVRMNAQQELQRIMAYKFPSGTIVNSRFVKIFNESYEEVIHNLKTNQMKVIEIDGALDPQFNADIVTKAIIKIYRQFQKDSEKIGKKKRR